MRYYDKKTRTEAIKGLHDFDDGDIIELEDDHIFFQQVPEGMELIYVDGVPDRHEAIPGYAEDKARDEWKASRADAVANIKVTTQAGNTFDGDEVSQSRMSRAIIALGTTPGGTVNWILADNTVVDVTAVELTEALALSGAAQAAIWVAQ